MRDVRFRRNFTNLARVSSHEQCWAIIAGTPSDFLEATSRWPTNTPVRTLVPMGSAVAVARQGVFLTNAHVVEPLDRDTLRAVYPGLDRILETLVTSLRAAPGRPGCATDFPPDPEFRRKFTQGFGGWVLDQILASARNDGVWVVARPREMKLFQIGLQPINLDILRGMRIRGLSLSELARMVNPEEVAVNLTSGAETPDKLATEADVLQVGQIYPGEDVAVLRTKTALDLVCLRLGDAGPLELPDGSHIIAFGFPSAADLPGLAKDKAHPQVISHGGEMLRRVSTSQGWEALFITAAVSNGDSGGPVLDNFGRVVGLTVFGSTSTSGNNLAVSVSLAKKYLQLAKVQADPGKTTERWERGLRYYFDKDYANALKEFDAINGKNQFLLGRGNEYVEQAIANCRSALGKKK